MPRNIFLAHKLKTTCTCKKIMQIKEKWFSFHYLFYIVAMSKAITIDFSLKPDHSTSQKKKTGCVTLCIYIYCLCFAGTSALRIAWASVLVLKLAQFTCFKRAGKNFRVTKETFHLICMAVAPVIFFL